MTAYSHRNSYSLGDQFPQGEALVNMVRQRMQTFSWNDVRHLNIQGVTNYCSNQPIAALVVAGVAMLAVLPVLLGLSLFMLSLLTCKFRLIWQGEKVDFWYSPTVPTPNRKQEVLCLFLLIWTTNVVRDIRIQRLAL